MEKKLILIGIVSFSIFLNSTSFGEIKVGDRELLKRESILRIEKKQEILENKNVDFKSLSEIEIVVGSSLVECFFGYQNNNRLVLCF